MDKLTAADVRQTAMTARDNAVKEYGPHVVEKILSSIQCAAQSGYTQLTRNIYGGLGIDNLSPELRAAVWHYVCSQLKRLGFKSHIFKEEAKFTVSWDEVN